MIQVRRSSDRGHANHGWLDTYHTFSFGSYLDTRHMGFRNLRVLNDDTVEPGMGFGTHGHKDMEIISYVVEGGLEHKDSMGTGSVLRPGDVQRMSAGTGVTHSEFNTSAEDRLRFLQVWVLPEKEGIEPEYEEERFSDAEKQGKLRLVVSPDGANGSLRIHQDVKVYASRLDGGESISHTLSPERHGWVQVVNGSLVVNGERLERGDGAALSQVSRVRFESGDQAEFLFFDLN